MALYNCFPQSTDPTNILDRFKYPEGQKNYPGFYHPKYVELLEQASLLNNTEKRAELLDEAERLLMSYMPITPIYHCNQGVLISPEFENVAFSPVSNLLFRNIKLAHQNNGSTLELSNL
jgi:oligopeptide transport system substrate-binding protein